MDRIYAANWRLAEPNKSLCNTETVGDSLDLDEHLFNKDKLVLTWKSSDNDVVTVDAQGRIKAIAEGEANVTVTSKDGKHTDYVPILPLIRKVLPISR